MEKTNSRINYKNSEKWRPDDISIKRDIKPQCGHEKKQKVVTLDSEIGYFL